MFKLFASIVNTSTKYNAEFNLVGSEVNGLIAIRYTHLSKDQCTALDNVLSGNATRQDVSTLINAINRFAPIVAPKGVKSWSKASL